MKRPPTDLEILNAIYQRHGEEFSAFDEANQSRSSKIYVPVDMAWIAKKLNADEDSIFGRLYYNLDRRYGYKEDDGSNVHLFAQRVGSDRNVVNFPLLEAVVAELHQSRVRFLTPMLLSILAITISIASYLK